MSEPTLIQRTGRAAFWNTLMVPALALLSLAFSVVIRRRFGLYAGVYDTALGIVATAVMFTSVGIPTSLTKFLPEIDNTSGAAAVVMFLRRVAAFRIAMLAVVLVPLNLFAEPFSLWLDMGDQGVLILRFASLLIVGRAVIDLCVRSLNAFFGQLRSNLLALVQGTLDFILVGAAVVGGYQIDGVFGMLVVSAAVTAVLGLMAVRGILGSLRTDERGSAFAPVDPGATRAAVESERSRFVGFAAFTFLFELSIYFSDKAFAAPVLAAVLGSDDVAIFIAGFSLAFMTVGLMVASFRGLYRPMFAHLRARDDPEQVRRAFAAVSKAQLALLLPAGIGLIVMVGDYVPLLYGATYAPAVPIARAFVVLLYVQTAFNLGIIWLSIDERYRVVLWAQSVQVVAAPIFVVVAITQGLLPAAVLFGSARVVVNVIGYVVCRRDYDFRFPWTFGAKVAAVAGSMGVILWVARGYLPQSATVAVALTIAGAIIYTVGLRLARVLGPEEIDILERSNIPAKKLALALLAPGR